MLSPLMISQKDDELLGVANRADAMGVLAVWSRRARDLVPHLSAQTHEVRGFQMLVEAYRLWESFEAEHPRYAGRLEDFFLLVEQVFARTAGAQDGGWPLPGSRRVMRQHGGAVWVSVVDPDWHLLDAQKANGVWGLYRGSAQRAGLLSEDTRRLSEATLKAATRAPGLGLRAQNALFKMAARAMEGESVRYSPARTAPLAADVYRTFREVPLAAHLREALIERHALNRALARRLVGVAHLEHRTFLTQAAEALPEHREAILGVVRCENLLGIVESIFMWLCACNGQILAAAVAELPVDLAALEDARAGFARSGNYAGETALARYTRLHECLETSTKMALTRSVLELHRRVNEERGRAPWVWEEAGVVRSDVEVGRPRARELEVGVVWRNSYYLNALHSITNQLAGLLDG
ncbi:hypothetical protein FRC98_07045 [Lujinxingia vulgaris]|uniref:Uncharacterized protein n=1 Tax=Lujinxingia vulgaris TaxID=2600176 RepID=A0A5C6XJH2_9DELT|nr:hypothetical protein [Lujinxingia vulgaris]TXD37446.1 hypothetical protein FRC98_07045 [Lujinxingia vulgaris]